MWPLVSSVCTVAKDFFVSYTSCDLTWAEWIAWILEENGHSVIIQAWDFRPGGNFILDMQRAAAEAERTIMVLSEAYLNAMYTQPEWAAAFTQDPTSTKRQLLPIRVAPCEPPGMLAAVVYVDLVGKTETEAEQLLLEALQERAKPSRRPSFPHTTLAPAEAKASNTTAKPFPLANTTKQPDKTSSNSNTSQPQPLPATERLRLIQTLNALPGPQFDTLLFALNPPSGNIPSNAAPQATRSAALLEWLESPIGPGLLELKAILTSIIPSQSSAATQTDEPSQTVETLKDIIKTLAENQPSKYDLRGAKFAGGFAETVQGDQIGSNQIS
ncbi:MAG: toll/interleukin-1 receptor domain-containing protein [Leptolyngbya sp. SIO3F4]|nr:toll/interleukin-1 receptor domain-containing protein [Leptolyngbya sp. SIO3F4]